MIKLVRCDDRMIHGQCIVRVLGDFGIERVIGVDDFTASNAVLKKIYSLAIPPRIKGGIFSVKEAVDEIFQHLTDAEKVLVLVKNPQTALELYKSVERLPKELNIGPMSSRKGAKKATMYAYLMTEEIAAIDEMTAMGVRVYFNQTTDQRTEEWERVRASLK